MVMHGRFSITLVKPRVSKDKCLTCHILSLPFGLQTIVNIILAVYVDLYHMVYISKSSFDVMVCIIIT